MISVLTPTRGRPASIARLHRSLEGTCSPDAQVELCLYIDDDDWSYDARLPEGRIPVRVTKGPRIVLSATWNELAATAAGDILMQCGDDIVFRSAGWDKLVEAEFARWPDRIVLVHGDAMDWGEAFGTHSFVHRNWVNALGYMTAPYFSCDYGDTWLNDVANMIRRRVFLPDVVTEHLHPIWGKSEWDRTHHERLERGQRDNVNDLYLEKAAERAADAAKLRALMC